jgi:CBS domain-containing protein
MILTKDWNWIKLKLFLKTIGKANFQFQSQLKCNACISHASNQIKLGRHLELLLSSIGFRVYLHQRGSNLNDVLKYQSLDGYFLLVPEKYEELLGRTASISREIESIVKEQPVCKIFLIYTDRVDEILLESLIKFLEEKSISHKVHQIDFTTFTQSLVHTVDQIRGLIMSKQSPNEVNDIMTQEVVVVRDDSKFSDVYYKMTTVGIRHCPVISSENSKCVGIISRRDLISKIPPGNLILPNNILIKYGISKLDQTKVTRELMTLGKQKVRDVFQIGVNPVIS